MYSFQKIVQKLNVLINVEQNILLEVDCLVLQINISVLIITILPNNFGLQVNIVESDGKNVKVVEIKEVRIIIDPEQNFNWNLVKLLNLVKKVTDYKLNTGSINRDVLEVMIIIMKKVAN